jgi:hypothetical protein
MEAAAVPAAESAAEPQVEAPEPQTPQLDPWQTEVESRLGEVGDTMRQMLDRLPQPEPEAEPDWAAQLNEMYGDTGVPDPQQLEGYIQQRIEHAVKTHTGPLEERFGQIQQTLSNQEIDALEVQHPELQNPQVAHDVIQRAWELADAVGARQLNAQLIRTAYFAGIGEAAGTQQETPAPGPGPAAQLEQGGGGSPAPQGEPTGWDRIKNSGSPSAGSMF